MFVLFNVLITTVLEVLDKALGWNLTLSGEPALGLLSFLYGAAVLVPSLAVCVRRLHDIGKHGVNYLWVLLPVIGWILMIVWFLMPGDQGTNEWGPDPKAEY